MYQLQISKKNIDLLRMHEYDVQEEKKGNNNSKYSTHQQQ